MTAALGGGRNANVVALARRYLLPQRAVLVRLVVVVLVFTVLALLAPLAVARYVQQAGRDTAASGLTLLAFAYIGLTILRGAATVLSDRIGERLAWAGTNALRRDLVRHALWLPPGGTETPATLLERVESDVVRLERVFSQLFVQLAASVLLAVGMLAVVTVADPLVGVVVAGYLVIAAVVLLVTQRRATRYMATTLDLSTSMLAVLGEASEGADELRVNGGERWIVDRFIERVLTLMPWRVRSNRAAFSIWTSSIAVHAGGVTVALAVGVLFGEGGISLATLFLLLQYLDTIRQPLEASRVELQSLSEASAAANRIAAFLDRPEVHPDTTAAPAPAQAARGAAVEITDAWFGYPGAAPVLRSVDIELASGESLALVGRTGSGKTTLLRALLGYVSPLQGSLLVDGRPPASMPPWERWSRVGAVAQQSRLFRASLRDNLTLFDAGIPDAEVLAALDRFQLTGWLAGREGGLDARIDVPEDVSAGEAQLIGVIRAVLRDRQVLLLDEISARLDARTELLLVSTMSELLRDRTTVIATHHLALFAACDKAILLHGGTAFGPVQLRGMDDAQVHAVWDEWRDTVGVRP